MDANKGLPGISIEEMAVIRSRAETDAKKAVFEDTGPIAGPGS